MKKKNIVRADEKMVFKLRKNKNKDLLKKKLQIEIKENISQYQELEIKPVEEITCSHTLALLTSKQKKLLKIQ